MVDPEGNLTGDKSLRFMDIVESSVREEDGQYVLTVVTAAPFPTPAEMAAGRRVDFIWFGCNRPSAYAEVIMCEGFA